MLSIQDITKKYEECTIIKNVNLNINKGIIYGLVGYNGTGKTTLLKTICGVLKPDAGTVLLDGQVVFDNATAKEQILYVPDNPYWLPHGSMKKMAKFYQGYYPNWNEGLFVNLVKLFDLNVNKRLKSFSKGMQRQASIILALSTGASYLLLDETFDGLDPLVREKVRELLKSAVEKAGVSILVASHNLSELEQICKSIALIRDKTLTEDIYKENELNNANKFHITFENRSDARSFLDELNYDLHLDVHLGLIGNQLKGNDLIFIAHIPEKDIRSYIFSNEKAKNKVKKFEVNKLTLEEMIVIDGTKNQDKVDYSSFF